MNSALKIILNLFMEYPIQSTCPSDNRAILLYTIKKYLTKEFTSNNYMKLNFNEIRIKIIKFYNKKKTSYDWNES